MRSKILLFLTIAFMSLTASQAQIRYFSVLLTGFNESPPNASPGVGYGQVTMNITAKTMRVYFGFTGLTGTTAACHIHAATANPLSGTAGVATPFGNFPTGVSAGSYDETFDMTLAASYNAAYITANGGTTATAFTALAAAMLAGKSYLNVHSSTFGGGEIRGFLRSCTPTSSTKDSTICNSNLPFMWDGLTFNGSGTQTRIISNGNSTGCDSAVIYNVTVASAGITSVSSTATTVCTNGTITLTANGVTGKNAVVNWYTQANGGGVYVGTGVTITPTTLGPNMYHARVTTDCGDVAEDSIAINQVLTTTFTSSNATCFGSATGSINNIVVSGGSSPYMVSTKVNSGFSNTNVLGNLQASSYRIFMQDNAGCTGFSDIIVIGQNSKIVTTSTKTDAGCYGTATGSINNISSTGGTGAPYTYSLTQGGAYNAVSSFPNLKASTYRVYTKDASGCAAIGDKIIVGGQTKITSTFTKTNANCPGSATGSITVTAAGGASGAFMYKNGPTGVLQNSGTFNGLKAGNYRIYITDGNGCSTFTGVINVANTNPSCGSFARVAPSANENANSGLSVYPNPAKGQFKLQLNGNHAGGATITITNQSGMAVESRKVTLSASQNVIAFDVTRFAPGTYFVKVMTAQGVEVTKVVVQ